MPIELRSTEKLIWARKRYRQSPTLIHIKVGSEKVTGDLLHEGQYYDVTACKAKVFGRPVDPALPQEASYATCSECREHYRPKRGAIAPLTQAH